MNSPSKVPERIGLVLRPHPALPPLVETILRECRSRGLRVLQDEQSAQTIPLPGTPSLPRADLAAHCDLLLVLGGDGTLLSVASGAIRHQTPLAGFNLGTLGFLTEFTREELPEYLPVLLDGKGHIRPRQALRVQTEAGSWIALNDVVVGKGEVGRIARMMLSLNGSPITTFRADGLILSTPTGSTAYSLAAGGPILAPQVEGCLITPICPHALTFRPLVVPHATRIALTIPEGAIGLEITVDGQTRGRLEPGAPPLHISMHDQMLLQLIPPSRSYYQLLSDKLKWGG